MDPRIEYLRTLYIVTPSGLERALTPEQLKEAERRARELPDASEASLFAAARMRQESVSVGRI